MTKRITSVALALVMLVSIFAVGTISTSAATSSKSYGHHYNKGDSASWIETITVDSTTKLTIAASTPIFDDNTRGSFSYTIKDSKNTYWLSKSGDNTKTSYTFYAYLKKGTYTIEYYTYGLYNHSYANASYKLTYNTNYKPAAPKITQKIKKTKYTYYTKYEAAITWDKKDSKGNFKYLNDYDGVEVYLKKDNGKWNRERTLYNGYSYYYGVTLTYYNNAYMFFYKVRAYKELKNGTKVYSKYSNVLYTKTSLKPSKPVIKSVKSTKKKQAVVKWKKVSGASGYVVYRSTKKSKGFKKVAAVKGAKYTNKKLKSRKTYYYKVKAFKKISGVKIYSSYSKVKKVKVK